MDHLPTLALLRQTKVSDRSPIEYTSHKLNDHKISQIHRKLQSLDWNSILNSDDVNINFDRFSNEIKAVMNTEAPLQTIRISGKRCYLELWVTKGLKTAARKNRKLYKRTIDASCTDNDITTYKKHRNMLNQLCCVTKSEYYNTKFYEYRTNTKKLWSLINQTINKCKNGGSIIPFITINGLITYNPKKIANSFSHFYSTIGENLAATILPGENEINYYLNKMPRSNKSLVL